MTPISGIKEYIYNSARGCPEPIMDRYVFEAVRDFMAKTQIWRVELPAINLVAGQTAYTITIPSPESTHAKLEKILWAKIEGNLLAAPAQYYMKPDETAIILEQAPSRNITGGLTIMISLNIKNGGTEIDDLIFTRFRQTISYKAKQHIASEKDKPYSDKEKVQEYRNQYLLGLEKALFEVQKKRSAGNIAVQPFPLFR